MTKKPAAAAHPKPKARKPQTLQQLLLKADGHPDQRFPVDGDPTHEILCKWVNGQTLCKQVPTGGDW